MCCRDFFGTTPVLHAFGITLGESERLLGKVILSFFDLADGFLCTCIFAATIFHYFIWKRGFMPIVSTAIFFTGILLTTNYLTILHTGWSDTGHFQWFVTHLYFSVALSLSILLSLFGEKYIKVHFTPFFFISFALIATLFLVAFFLAKTSNAPGMYVLTDSALLYYFNFESTLFFFYLLVPFSLLVVYHRARKSDFSFGLVLSGIFFLIAYAAELFIPNTDYFYSHTLSGFIELFAFFLIAWGIFQENYTLSKWLIAAKEDAEVLSHAKNTFISNFSYQVRAPMNTIVGYTELLEEGVDGELNEKMKSSVEEIKKASSTLLTFLNQIIDVSRIESGKISFQVEEFSLSTLLKNTIKQMEASALEKDLQLKEEIPNEDILYLGDEKRIKQMLFHVIENAIKYTEKGEVVVSVQNVPKQVEIAVTDTGVGISEKRLTSIFKPFTPQEETHKEGSESLGIGLTIVRLIAHAIDAKIDIKTEKNVGTTFFITLQKE